MTGSAVHLTVPAASAYAVVARTAAASVASGVGATLESVEDLRIVASEAFTLALATIPADHDSLVDEGISLSFTTTGDAIDVQVSSPAAAHFEVDRGSFSWTILDALLEGMACAIEPADGAHRLTITGRTRLHVPA